ncbi:hypothetical protein C8C99_4043 [Acidovorax sp. 107]|uniref:hypothetical protein n=1 Tax=Acidovorax sp. 107 TaxID=2135638 RepID=UPI000D3A5F4D|nr:hypothetical protein [Acidovorax sp. 107]PUA99160.1 hypothetical protein C8C99_4043 [Acidovorax sp. 107]
MTTTNKAAFGLSARAIDTSEFATIYETSECLFEYDNGGSRTFVMTDSSGVDFLAIQDGADGNVVIVELADAHESAHHHAREVLNRVF